MTADWVLVCILAAVSLVAFYARWRVGSDGEGVLGGLLGVFGYGLIGLTAGFAALVALVVTGLPALVRWLF